MKKRKFLLGAVATVVALLLAACHDEKEPEIKETLPAQQTIFMYVPWAGGGSIYSASLKNIAAMKTAVEYRKGLGNKRLMVFMADTPNRASLFEIKYEGGQCVNDTLTTYNTLTADDYVTVEGMENLFGEAVRLAPAYRYGMIVSCHGTGWVSAGATFHSKQHVSQRIPILGKSPEQRLETRAFGTPINGDASFQTEIPNFAQAVRNTFGCLDFVVFDDCNMQNIETAYALRNVADNIIASTCEVLMDGIPYATVGGALMDGDYDSVVKGFCDYYRSGPYVYGTLSWVRCSELEATAQLVKQVNREHAFTMDDMARMQLLDDYIPPLFFDMGTYLKTLCRDDGPLYERVEEQMDKLVPSRDHTGQFYCGESGRAYTIESYSGITISDPSVSPAAQTKTSTEWWQATHD